MKKYKKYKIYVCKNNDLKYIKAKNLEFQLKMTTIQTKKALIEVLSGGLD